MISDELNTTEEESVKSLGEKVSYEDSEERAQKAKQEEDLKFAEIQAAYNEKQAEMIDQIRDMEIELRELEAMQKFDDDAEAKETKPQMDMNQLNDFYHKLSVSCMGIPIMMLLIWLVLITVDNMLAQPPEEVEVVELDGEEAAEGAEDAQDADATTEGGEEDGRRRLFTSSLHNNTLNVQSLSRDSQPPRTSFNKQDAPRTPFNKFSSRILENVLIMLPDYLTTNDWHSQKPKSSSRRKRRASSSPARKTTRKDKRKRMKSRAKLQMKSEKKKKAWLKAKRSRSIVNRGH